MDPSMSVKDLKALWEEKRYLVEHTTFVGRGIARVEEESFSHCEDVSRQPQGALSFTYTF